MTKKALAEYKAALEAKLAQLREPLADQIKDLKVNQQADQMDSSIAAQQIQLSTVVAEHSSATLVAIHAALGRIQDGTYGECLRCAKDINVKRLKAVPEAGLCIECQTKAEEANRSLVIAYSM